MIVRSENVDIKEQKMLQHYKNIIENRTFDEYDILGFLIFIRRHLEDSQKYIRDFADLIAHREREWGLAINCIKAAIDNQYQTKNGGKKVKDYHGIDYSIWYLEWKELGLKQNIVINDEIIQEITLCIFSLAQHTKYDDKRNHAGKMDLFQGKDNSLALATSENKSDSLFVCFAKTPAFNFVRKLSTGYLRKPVETVREKGKLRLRDEDGYII